jgi:hypothetical protein
LAKTECEREDVVNAAPVDGSLKAAVSEIDDTVEGNGDVEDDDDGLAAVRALQKMTSEIFDSIVHNKNK